jgi:RNA polymerase sigma-70 factor (ECF subfamily)
MSDAPIVPLEQLLAHEGWIRGLARGLVADDSRADDVVQETWMTALRAPPRTGGAVRAWLASVVRSRAADARKAEKRRVALETAASRRDDVGSGRDPVADAAAATEIHRRLTSAVMALDEPYRSAVILRFFEGLPPRDVGARTGVPAETARTRVNRGLAMLRARFDAEDGGRRRWTALLVPIAGLGETTGSDGPSGATAGAAAMATAKTYATAAALVALCVGAYWWLRDDGVAAPATDVATAKRDVEAPARPTRPRAEAPAPAPAVAEKAPATTTPSLGARVRLRFIDETGAPIPSEVLKARWGGGTATPSVALFDDRALRSPNRSDWLHQTVEGTGDAVRPVPLDETPDAFALKERVPPGRWRIVAFPGAATATLSRPFTVTNDGGAVDVDVTLAPTELCVVRVTDRATHAAVEGARLVPIFGFRDAAFVAGAAVTTDAAGEARLPVESRDGAELHPITWWATAPGRFARFRVRPGDGIVDVAMDPTFDVEGEAFLVDGSPAAGRTVVWHRIGMTIEAVCDAAGRFKLAGVPTDEPKTSLFLIEDSERGVLRSGTVETKPGDTATMRFDAPASNTARIAVRLTAGGWPVRGMAVTCREGIGATMALTDADGTATLTGFPPGAQPTVVVLLCDPRVAQDFTAAAKQPALAAGETRTLSLDLPVGAIRVRVVAADGSPAAGALVLARPTDKSTLDPNGQATAPRPEEWAVKYGDARFADDEGATLLTGLSAGGACEVTASDGVAGLKASTSIVPGTLDAPAETTLTLK